MSGKTIEVVEHRRRRPRRTGRRPPLREHDLTSPKRIVDLATLTGACDDGARSLGDGGLRQRRGAASRRCARPARRRARAAWPMPLFDAHEKAMRSEIADIKNTGGPRRGRLDGGRRSCADFVGDTPWVHLDIAGTGWHEQDGRIHAGGATGVGVRLLLQWCAHWDRDLPATRLVAIRSGCARHARAIKLPCTSRRVPTTGEPFLRRPIRSAQQRNVSAPVDPTTALLGTHRMILIGPARLAIRARAHCSPGRPRRRCRRGQDDVHELCVSCHGDSRQGRRSRGAAAAGQPAPRATSRSATSSSTPTGTASPAPTSTSRTSSEGRERLRWLRDDGPRGAAAHRRATCANVIAFIRSLKQ